MRDRANSQVAAVPIGWMLALAHERAARLVASVTRVIDVYADSYAAAALYEKLSKLSDAELERRGIPRRPSPVHLGREILTATTSR